MIRRMLCLLCAIMLLSSAVPVSAEEAESRYSYDFDLTFFLNAESFPVTMRSRIASYSALLNRIGVRGNIAWSTKTESMELDLTVYFTDKPSLSYPLRFYGSKAWLFCTSPMINNAVMFFDLNGLMEYSVKVRNTLNLPLPYFALLYPYTTELPFEGIVRAWQDIIGIFKKSGKVTTDQLSRLAERWKKEFQNSNLLNWWIVGLSGGPGSPTVVENEILSLPDYVLRATGNKPVSVKISKDSEIWKDASGNTLFSRKESGGELSVTLSLPPSERGYAPALFFLQQSKNQTLSFETNASLRRDPSDSLSAEDIYAESCPELLLDFHAEGTGIPEILPADSAFSLSATILGDLYPNYTFSLNGETKKEGTVFLSLSKPYGNNPIPTEILHCSGTFVPSSLLRDIPDYYVESSLNDVYYVFAFNEQRLDAFTQQVLPPLIRSVFSFVAAAPTSACQAFLDDLTDTGLLDIILE